MRITIYDKNPGPGIGQWLLSFSWRVGCFLQKLFGKVDKYYGAESWEDACYWIELQNVELSSVQYWGHGSPGTVWLAGKEIPLSRFIYALKWYVSPETVVWFRTCSTFQGSVGHSFSWLLANELNCIVAGHTRIIGLVQGGLHTRRPNTMPSWPVTEGELENAKWPYVELGNNSIFCLTTKIPNGW
jgi:hypothetical protein